MRCVSILHPPLVSVLFNCGPTIFPQAVPSEWGLDMDTVSQFSQGPLATPGQGRKSVGDKQPRSEPTHVFVSLVF